MIVNLILKNYKAYRGVCNIPLSNTDPFTGIIGNNGAGKSSVLAALDCFFNNEKWEKNKWCDRFESSYIQPVFLIRAELIKDIDLLKIAIALNNAVWKQLDHGSFIPADKEVSSEMQMLQDILHNIPEEYRKGYLLLPLGENEGRVGVWGILDAPEILNTFANSLFEEQIGRLKEYIKQMHSYLYIPDDLTVFDKQIPQEGNRLPFSLLSSGEKQQALLGWIQHKLQEGDTKKQISVLGYDEPGAWLEISSCYDQFEKLFSLVNENNQVLVASRWYGFIPILTAGMIVDILVKDGSHQFLHFEIARYREDIKIQNRLYRLHYHEELSIDIMLKTSNDFIQSILGGVTNDDPYNWLICEGSTEKIFFNYYLKDLILSKNLRIAPVGGSREVKKLYQYLSVAFNDLKEYIRGKVILLMDTDSQLLEFETPSIAHLFCYRIVNQHGRSLLVHVASNPKSPKTEIEDVLNGRVFQESLKSFKDEYPKILSFVNLQEIKPEEPSYYAMNLTPSEDQQLTSFFDAHHANKVRFAQKYVEICSKGNYKVPEWIEEIRRIFETD